VDPGSALGLILSHYRLSTGNASCSVVNACGLSLQNKMSGGKLHMTRTTRVIATEVIQTQCLLINFLLQYVITSWASFVNSFGSVPIRRNPFRRNPIRRNATLTLTLNPNPNLTLTLTLNPNFGETGFGETGRHHSFSRNHVRSLVCLLALFLSGFLFMRSNVG